MKSWTILLPFCVSLTIHSSSSIPTDPPTTTAKTWKGGWIPLLTPSPNAQTISSASIDPAITNDVTVATTTMDTSTPIPPTVPNDVVPGDGASFLSSQDSSFPFMVAIVQIKVGTPPTILLGASLIDDRHIVTSAKMMEPVIDFLQGGLSIEAWIGADDLDTFDGQKIPLRSDDIVQHPDFQSPLPWNDICVIKLQTPVQMTANNKISPICIGSDSAGFGHGPVHLIGFGNLGCGFPTRRLHFATGEAIQWWECQNIMQNMRGFRTPPPEVRRSQICTQSMTGLGGVTAAPGRGDEGGPLFSQSNQNGDYMLVGLFSIGFRYLNECPIIKIPGVYTMVGFFWDFITKNAPGAKRCVDNDNDDHNHNNGPLNNYMGPPQ